MKYFENRRVYASTAKGYILTASFLFNRLNWVPPPKPPKIATEQITEYFDETFILSYKEQYDLTVGFITQTETGN